MISELANFSRVFLISMDMLILISLFEVSLIAEQRCDSLEGQVKNILIIFPLFLFLAQSWKWDQMESFVSHISVVYNLPNAQFFFMLSRIYGWSSIQIVNETGSPILPDMQLKLDRFKADSSGKLNKLQVNTQMSLSESSRKIFPG